MKIAMVCEHANPLAVPGGADAGGRNVHVAALAAAMTGYGHEVSVYTRRDDPDLPPTVLTADGYCVTHVPVGPATVLAEDELLPYIGAFGQFLDDEWSRRPPDVAHAHSWMSGIATQLAARRRGVPSVQTFHALGVVKRRHQSAEDSGPEQRQLLESMVAEHADWVAATCTDEVFELIRMGRARSRISVVPCGVDADVFSPIGDRAERDDRPRILSVGRLVPRNGFDTMIRALPWIPGAELVIAGGPSTDQLDSDPEARRLRALAEELGVGRRVRLLGAVRHRDMPALYRSANLVACTPWYEPLGIVPLEAMACGVPVIANAVGSLIDIVVDDVTGRLVPPRNPARCARAANAILREQFVAHSLGSAGRDRAVSRYSPDRTALDTLRIYDRLVPSAGESMAQ